MLIQTAHHTITLHDDFAVIVPHPGHELTSEHLKELVTHVSNCEQLSSCQMQQSVETNKPILFFPHNQYSVSFCAMKELIHVQDKIQLGIVSGSERTRMVFGFLTDLCKGVNILSDTHEMNQWLATSLEKDRLN